MSILFYIFTVLVLLLSAGMLFGRKRLQIFENNSRLEELLDLKTNSLNESELRNIAKLRPSSSEEFTIFGQSENFLKYLCLALFSFLGSTIYLLNLNKIDSLSVTTLLVVNFIAIYIGLVVFLFARRWYQQTIFRRILFQTPLVLESLILLVESGLGILPAIEKVISSPRGGKRNITIEYLDRIYNLSLRGLPFSEAIELVADTTENKVLRHTLLHLDASQTEGGELVPALKSLANHSHSEWKLDSEARVKRLENLVVFPVFVSVIGLMLLSASVPLVPVFEFNKSLADPSKKLQPYLEDSNVR